MFFLALMATLSGVALVWSVVRAAPLCWRSVLRYGMAGAFLFTGFDHFLSLETRYLPMIPPYLGPFGRELVIASGVAELAGALGLLLPRAAWSRLRLYIARATMALIPRLWNLRMFLSYISEEFHHGTEK